MGESVELPDKLFFKIGEVSRIVGIEPHVLRYWEKEFAIVRPRKSHGGQRMYKRSDVEALLRIKNLLRDEGFTIAGAKKQIAIERNRRNTPQDTTAHTLLDDTEAEPVDEATRRLLDEVERLKDELHALRLDRAATGRHLAAAQEALRQVRRELANLQETLASTNDAVTHSPPTGDPL